MIARFSDIKGKYSVICRRYAYRTDFLWDRGLSCKRFPLQLISYAFHNKHPIREIPCSCAFVFDVLRITRLRRRRRRATALLLWVKLS